MRGIVVLGAALLGIAIGCGGAETGVGGSAGAGGSEGGASTATSSGGSGGAECAPPACPVGWAPGASGDCEPVGIQGCAPLFVDADGVCRPSMKKCADSPGTIPKFEEGCIAVGIPDCAPDFIEEDGLCHPSMAKCPVGTYAVPQEGCVPIDGADGCGVGTWGGIPDTPETRYVDPTFGGPVSDGTKAMPYKSLTTAVASVSPGATIALAAGTYPESVSIWAKPVTIVGRCPSMTVIEPPGPLDGGFTISGIDGVTIERLTIAGAAPAVYLTSATNVTLREVVVRDATAMGIRANATQMALEHVFITDMQPYVLDGMTYSYGIALVVEGGTHMTVHHSAVVESNLEALEAYGAGTELTLEDSLVEGTTPDILGGKLGIGVAVELQASTTLRATAVVGNRHSGVGAFGSGTTVEILQSDIEGTQPELAMGTFGCGVNAQEGPHFEVRGSTVIRNTFSGLLTFGGGSPTTLNASENLIAWTEFPGQGRFGLGAIVAATSTATFTDNVFWQNHTGGVLVHADDGVANLSRVLIEGTLPAEATGQDGGGALSFSGGMLTVDSCAIVDNHVGAIGVVLAKSSVAHSLLGGTRSGSIYDDQDVLHEEFGDGLLAHLSKDVTVETTIVEDNARAGLVFSASSGVIRSCDIRDNTFGVVLQGGPDVDFDAGTCNLSGDCAHLLVSDGDLKVPSAPTGL